MKNNWPIVLVVGIGVFLLCGIIAQPYFEAKTYNKFRKPDQPQASYWDAMWGDLRITSE